MMTTPVAASDTVANASDAELTVLAGVTAAGPESNNLLGHGGSSTMTQTEGDDGAGAGAGGGGAIKVLVSALYNVTSIVLTVEGAPLLPHAYSSRNSSSSGGGSSWRYTVQVVNSTGTKLLAGCGTIKPVASGKLVVPTFQLSAPAVAFVRIEQQQHH